MQKSSELVPVLAASHVFAKFWKRFDLEEASSVEVDDWLGCEFRKTLSSFCDRVREIENAEHVDVARRSTLLCGEGAKTTMQSRSHRIEPIFGRERDHVDAHP